MFWPKSLMIKRLGRFKWAGLLALMLVAIAGAGLAANSWILSPNNFFINDDYDWLHIAAFSNYQSMFHLLPAQAYNDRPVGAMFIKLLYDLFGTSSRLHHGVLMGVHLVNGLLVFWLGWKLLAQKRVAQAKLIAFCAGLWFAAWPEALFLIGWDAGIFDLLGCTLFLMFMLVHISSRGSSRRWLWGSVMAVLLLLSLRTKEMAVTLPVLALVTELWLRGSYSRAAAKDALVRLALPFGVLAVYLGAIAARFGSHEAGFGEGSPYFVSLNPLQLLGSVPKYLDLYFNPFNPAYDVSGGRFEALTIALIVLVAIIALHLLSRRQGSPDALPFMFLLGVMSLGPVLPLVNSVQRLYLYFPSAFLAIGVAIAAVRLTGWLAGRWPTVASATAVGLVVILPWLALETGANQLFRSYYLRAALKNKQVYAQLAHLPRPHPNQTLVLSGQPRLGEYLPFLDRYPVLEPMQIIFHDDSLRYRKLAPGETCPDCYIMTYKDGLPIATQR
jgi:hypothetical protein